ncbi:MAG: indolepyruvate oxidoreductase subunit beta [Deltaproteobacteria bacterium]|jgi:indolepyruvate ferredoxin oxidoreductase, beta subunit|nr:indolepyruvate oxidoreductase subunit beta [Deltaproteobacteria bacterium]
MKKDIIFAGVGGQGIVSAAAMIVTQVDKLGFQCKQNEVHGMAQRGGSVVCHVRISDGQIYSDIIPKGSADLILATEPMEALRYIEYLSKDGTVITSNRPFKNIDYPDEKDIINSIEKRSNSIVVDANGLVDELKNERVINVAMIGALSKAIGIEGLKDGILKDVEKRFSKKGEAVVQLNHKAFEFGEAAVQ